MDYLATGSSEPLPVTTGTGPAEYIRLRLLEKETRILKIIDVHVDKKRGNSYDFSAKIFIAAETLTDAAEIIDSANAFLENEFNIKDSRLIPVIQRNSLGIETDTYRS